MIDYDNYSFTKIEWVLYVMEGFCIATLLGWLFYRSILAVILLLGTIYFFINYKKKTLKLKRKEELNLQFKDGIQAIASALTAGYSIENAFIEAVKDLRMVYPEEACIVKEFEYIVKNLEVNVTVESLLLQLAKRSQVEDIKSFVDVFVTAKRSGGDFISIIRMTVQSISEKIEVKREIVVLISAKKLEQRIMNVIPLFMILYISISSKGYLDILYHSFLGHIIMTVCLLIYGFSFYYGNKIVQIEV